MSQNLSLLEQQCYRYLAAISHEGLDLMRDDLLPAARLDSLALLAREQLNIQDGVQVVVTGSEIQVG